MNITNPQKNMTPLSLLITSFPEEKTARSVIRSLVEERLAACGTIIPQALSIYSWQGKIEEASEVIVFIKTSSPCLERCMERLAELHPYEVPEIVALKPEAVGEAYAAWIKKVLN